MKLGSKDPSVIVSVKLKYKVHVFMLIHHELSTGAVVSEITEEARSAELAGIGVTLFVLGSATVVPVSEIKVSEVVKPVFGNRNFS